MTNVMINEMKQAEIARRFKNQINIKCTLKRKSSGNFLRKRLAG